MTQILLELVQELPFTKEDLALIKDARSALEDCRYPDIASMIDEENNVTAYSITYNLNESRLWIDINSSKKTTQELKDLFTSALKDGLLLNLYGLDKDKIDLRFQDFRQNHDDFKGKIAIDFSVPIVEKPTIESLKKNIDELTEKVDKLTDTVNKPVEKVEDTTSDSSSDSAIDPVIDKVEPQRADEPTQE